MNFESPPRPAKSTERAVCAPFVGAATKSRLSRVKVRPMAEVTVMPCSACRDGDAKSLMSLMSSRDSR